VLAATVTTVLFDESPLPENPDFGRIGAGPALGGNLMNFLALKGTGRAAYCQKVPVGARKLHCRSPDNLLVSRQQVV